MHEEFIVKLNEIHETVVGMASDVTVLKKEAKKTNGRIGKLEEQRMSDIQIHSKFESDFANHAIADERRFDALEKIDDKIFKKLDELTPLVYKAGVVFTIVLTIIGGVMLKFLAG